MIWSIVILAVGLLLAVLAVVLHKKLGKSWMTSGLVLGVVLAVLGGWFLRGQLTQAQESREAVYLGLQCLERYDTEAAAFYLRQAKDGEDYVASAATGLLERMRGNDLVARLNLDAAEAAAGSEEQSTFLDTLRVLDINSGEHIALAAERLADFLGLSSKRQEALDLYLDMASGYYNGSEEELEELGVDETAWMRLQVGAMLNNGSLDGAVRLAAQLADESPKEENRLLLAEAVAESAYQGVVLSADAFTDWEDTEEPDQSAQKERESLDAERTELETRLLELEIQTEGVEDQEALASLNEEKVELTEKIQDLQNRSDKLYIYRAFSAIADLKSLEADLVRARLYFALQQYDEAVEALRSSAGSLRAKLTTDREMANALRIVENAYEGDAVFYETQEFRDAVTQLLTAPFSDLMYVGQSTLTQDFTQRIISDQKEYGQDLFLSSLDISSFPTVRVTLSGREELLEQVAERSGVTARDTRKEISYTAEMSEGQFANICVVVDCSGSMDGSPMEDLKTALDDFVRNMAEATSVSLVAFESSARKLTDLTQDQAMLLSTVANLSGGGGTNISSGIQAGTEVLAQAPGSRVMLLMTDGQSDIDMTVVEEAAAAGITIHTIGFGDVNDQLLEQIAQETGGQYIRADSSAELSNVYASLQQVIGNVVTLTYTAEDTETPSRYFFLEADGSSVYRTYFLGQEEETAPVLYTSNPSLLSPSYLEQIVQRGSNITISLSGDNLLSVASVTVGGQTTEILDQRSDTLQVSVTPQFSTGWQEVVLTTEGGETISFDRLILVGESQYFRNLRLGSIQIPYADGILPGDGTLVLVGRGIRLQENVTAEASSLNLSVSGTLILPWQQPAAAEGETVVTSDIDLGDQGTITGWGLVTLERNDSAYSSGAPSVVAKGQLTLTCGPEQSQLIQGQEGGN